MSVTQDATSLKYIPQTSAEWTALLTGTSIGNPSQLYRCQEASGNITDSISGITGTKFGSPTFQNAVTGWASKALITAIGSNGWNSSSASLPDLTTQSVMVFAWVLWPGVHSGSWGFSYGAPFISGQVTFENSSGGVFDVRAPSGFTTSANSYVSTTGPLIMQFNRTAGTLVGQTDLETISRSCSVSSSSKLFYLGGDNGANTNGSGNMGYMYFAAWFGAAAEMSSTDRGTLLTRLNNGPPASGSGRLAGTSPLSASGLVSSPLVNNTKRRARMPGPTRYFDCHGGI